MSTTTTVRCTVHGRHGAVDVIEQAPFEHDLYRPPYADRTSLRSIMSHELICARPDLDIATVVSLVIERRVGCLPVVDGHRKPVGVITKFDLVEQLQAQMRGVRACCPLPADLQVETADDVMMPIALTLYEHASVSQAAAMMISEDTHHVLVVNSDGALVGVVSAKDIVRWVASHDLGASAQPAKPAWRPLEG